MFNIGQKVTKDVYTRAAIWANKNNAKIVQRGDEYEIVAIPEPTVKELQAEVRAVRNSYLEKYVDPKQLVLVWDGLSEGERQLYVSYRQYLLDYTKLEDWYLNNPMTFDEWNKGLNESIEEIITEDIEETLS